MPLYAVNNLPLIFTNHKWMAAIETFVPKILGALEISDNSLISSPCAKLMILLKILCKNLLLTLISFVGFIAGPSCQ